MSSNNGAALDNLNHSIPQTIAPHLNETEKPITIRPESPTHPQLGALWAAKVALSRALYPAESDYSYSPAELAAPHIYFLVAEVEGEFVGCGAAANQGDYGEIKSMFVMETMRGRRIGEQLIRRLEDHMRQVGLSISRLETGVESHSALRLYERMGYTRRSPFGNYVDDPLCVFMEKQL